MVSKESLEQMVVSAAALGWRPPVPEEAWPEAFNRDGRTWTKDHLTVAQRTGEVQCGEYTDDEGNWLIVYNE